MTNFPGRCMLQPKFPNSDGRGCAEAADGLRPMDTTRCALAPIRTHHDRTIADGSVLLGPRRGAGEKRSAEKASGWANWRREHASARVDIGGRIQ